jgi:hypothetical protein
MVRNDELHLRRQSLRAAAALEVLNVQNGWFRITEKGAMTQPFDNRDWDVRKLAEKDAELERLKSLLTRAADALEAWHKDSKLTFNSLRKEEELIAELREAGNDPTKSK